LFGSFGLAEKNAVWNLTDFLQEAQEISDRRVLTLCRKCPHAVRRPGSP
jgi:hypothetical protein